MLEGQAPWLQTKGGDIDSSHLQERGRLVGESVSSSLYGRSLAKSCQKKDVRTAS